MYIYCKRLHCKSNSVEHEDKEQFFNYLYQIVGDHIKRSEAFFEFRQFSMIHLIVTYEEYTPITRRTLFIYILPRKIDCLASGKASVHSIKIEMLEILDDASYHAI